METTATILKLYKNLHFLKAFNIAKSSISSADKRLITEIKWPH